MKRSLGTTPVLCVGILLIAAAVLLSVATGYLDVPFPTVLGDLASGLRGAEPPPRRLRLPR